MALDTRRLLLERGHDVRVHAMAYASNMQLAEAAEWPSEVSFRGGIGAKVKAMRRVFGADEARRRAREVVRSFRPDVVHLHNVHSYLSPVLAEVAREEGVRTVWTIHDSKLVCPAGTLRGRDGAYCDECVDAPEIKVLRRRCSHDSAVWSAASWLESLVWNRRRLDAATDVFVVPSCYLAQLMVRAGFAPEKIRIIGNPLRSEMVRAVEADATPFASSYYLYAGRLSPEKGVTTLLEAAIRADVPVVVAGAGPEEDELRGHFGRDPRVRFTGHVDAPQLVHLLRGARAAVLPSEGGENYPLAAIEALCAGTPVIGSRIGGIPEIVAPGCGELFAPGDADELEHLLASFDHMPEAEREELARKSMARYSPEAYLSALTGVYGKEGSA